MAAQDAFDIPRPGPPTGPSWYCKRDRDQLTRAASSAAGILLVTVLILTAGIISLVAGWHAYNELVKRLSDMQQDLHAVTEWHVPAADVPPAPKPAPKE